MSNTAAGITRYGVYIPSTRLPLAMIHGGRVKEGGPEKAVAGFDEDSITMAVTAAADCLQGMERKQIDGLYFASTTSPFREKQAAAFVAKALDLRSDISTIDFGGTLRAAAAALQAAINAVKADPAKQILVVASDSRLAAPRSPIESNFGDAAAAFLIGSDSVIATLEDSYAIADEIYDTWRSDTDKFVRSWEDRFVITHGYQDNLVKAGKALLEKQKRPAKDYSKAVLYAPDARSLASAAKALGFAPDKIQEALFGKVGNCGAAFAPLLFIAALEQAKQGDHLFLGFYGDGAEVLAITVQKNSFKAHHSIAWYLKRGKALRSYDSYLKSRHLEAGEFDRRGGDGVPATVHFRERDSDISFHAQKCTKCGTMHFPACRVCFGCYAKDSFEPVRLSDKKGRVMSFTFDYFFPSPEPPLIVGMCEVENGARVYVQMTDATQDMLRCDLPVEFVFRKIHDVGHRPNYFWKSRPLVNTAEVAA
jgi:hydroxymethylglutaryl-CoA synthase